MTDLTLVTETTDPTTLYGLYQALSVRYDEAGAQLDQLQAQLDQVEDDTEREHLAAEMDRLSVGHSVLLGWVSAFFAAYTFARRGTDSPWLDPDTRGRAAFVTGPNGAQR